MHVSQLIPVPPGLRAIYVVLVRIDDDEDNTETVTQIIDRPVDALCLLELQAEDIRKSPRERQGAQRGRKTKVAGLIMEGMTEPKPAPTATSWFERLYGDKFVRAEFVGYTRSEHTIEEIMQAVAADQKNEVPFPEGEETVEMRNTRRYWAKAIHKVLEGL